MDDETRELTELASAYAELILRADREGAKDEKFKALGETYVLTAQSIREKYAKKETERLMATRTKDKEPARVDVAEYETSGEKIMLPSGMSLRNAIKALERREKFEEEETGVQEYIDCHPADGAYALRECLTARFGWAQAEKTPGFFGDQPPMMISVEIGPHQSVNVPWGRFSIPNVDGWIQTGLGKRQGRQIFSLNALVKRKHESAVKKLADDVREYVRLHSIYRGRAIKVNFTTESSFFEGDQRVANITFLDVSEAHEDRLVFSQHVEDAIRTNLYTPLERYDDLGTFGIPFKRGILLVGNYGVGKTEVGYSAAKKAVDNDITFIMCSDVQDFSEVVAFGRQYDDHGCCIFGEDIDRVTAGERSAPLDTILNTIDGLDAKSSRIMVCLTTNEVERIHEAMLRPGRLDAVIEIERPDGPASERLMRLYGRGLIPEKEDIQAAGYLMQGQIPAVQREVVERTKLAALRRTEPGVTDLVLSGEALVESANTMNMQLGLLNREHQVEPSDLVVAFGELGKWVASGMAYLSAAKDPYAEKRHDKIVALRKDEPEDNDRYRAIPEYPEGAMSTLRAARNSGVREKK